MQLVDVHMNTTRYASTSAYNSGTNQTLRIWSMQVLTCRADTPMVKCE